MLNFSDASLCPLQLSNLFKILLRVWDPECRIFYFRAATEVKSPHFSLRNSRAACTGLSRAPTPPWPLVSTGIHSYFSALLPPLRCSMLLCSKGKPPHWVLLKWWLFHNIHCLLGNWDPSRATSCHHNSIQNHSFGSSRLVRKMTYPWLEVMRHH